MIVITWDSKISKATCCVLQLHMGRSALNPETFSSHLGKVYSMLSGSNLVVNKNIHVVPNESWVKFVIYGRTSLTAPIDFNVATINLIHSIVIHMFQNVSYHSPDKDHTSLQQSISTHRVGSRNQLLSGSQLDRVLDQLSICQCTGVQRAELDTFPIVQNA